jgi:hypothetical protein
MAVAAIQLSLTGALRPAARSLDTSRAQASETALSTGSAWKRWAADRVPAGADSYHGILNLLEEVTQRRAAPRRASARQTLSQQVGNARSGARHQRPLPGP